MQPPATPPDTTPVAPHAAPAEAMPTEPVGWGWRAALLLLWALAGFGTLGLARHMSDWKVGAWPLPYWLAAQGVMVLYVAIPAFYAWLANRRERAAQTSSSPPPA